MSLNEDDTKARIVALNVDRIEEIVEICSECFPFNYTYQFFYRLLSQPSVLCRAVECKNKLIGLLIAEIKVIKASSSLMNLIQTNKEEENNSRVGYLCILCVRENYRRTGVASKLMKRFIKTDCAAAQSNIKYIYLHTPVINEAGISFYRRLHFKVISTIKDYYFESLQGNSDAYVFALKLEDWRVKAKRRHRSCIIDMKCELQLNI